MTVTPGTVLANKYRVERILGRGGMGLVVEATHLSLDRRVALKFLHTEAMGNPIAVERFQREARAAARIDHPHVARVLDVETAETGASYMVMEYLEGVDLEVWLRQNGKLPVEQVATFMLQVCDAIAEAHRVGLVHRDIKPANLFVTHTSTGLPHIKVLDFGISKVVKDPIGSVTKTTSFLGSPLYMSPEQMKSSKDVDARSDIWSLGAVLFELLTGDVPFRAETIPELTLKVALAPTPSVTLARPDVSVLLESVVHRCLEKDRELRYGSARELADALEPFAVPSKLSERRSSDARDAAVGGQVESGAQTRTADLPDGPYSVRGKPTGTESSWSRPDAVKASASRRWPLAIAALCVPSFAFVWFTVRQDGLSSGTGSTELNAAKPATDPVVKEPLRTTEAPVEPAVGAATNVPGPPDVGSAGELVHDRQTVAIGAAKPVTAKNPVTGGGVSSPPISSVTPRLLAAPSPTNNPQLERAADPTSPETRDGVGPHRPDPFNNLF